MAHKEAPIVSVLDLHRRETIATVDLPGGAEEIDISTDGKAFFVVTPMKTPRANPGPSKVVKIDAASKEIVAAVELEPTVVAIRTTAGGMVLAPEMYVGDGNQVDELFASQGGQVPGKLHVIDGETMKLLNMIELDRMSFTIRAQPRPVPYVANVGAGTVSVVDIDQGELVRSVDCTPSDRVGGTHGMSLISVS